MHKDSKSGITIVHPGNCKCEKCVVYTAPSCNCNKKQCECDIERPMTPVSSPRFKKVKKSSKSYKKVKKSKKAKKSKRKSNKKSPLRR